MWGWPPSSCTASFPSTGWSSPRCESPEGRSTEFIPSPISIENYQGVFSAQNNFGRSLINSLIVAGTTTILTLLFGIVGAYALARLRFRGKGGALADHGLLDVPAGCVAAATAEAVLLDGAVHLVPVLDQYLPVRHHSRVELRPPACGVESDGFFKQLPVELEQAAMVDGCTPGVAFRKVILPLAAPGVFTTAIIVFIGAWNEFLLALTFLQDASRQTATVAISKFTGTTGLIRRTAPSWRPVWL